MTTFSLGNTGLSPTPASVSQPAPGVGRRNVITGIVAQTTNSAGAITLNSFLLRDGASGVGAVVFGLTPRTNGANVQNSFAITFDVPFIMSENAITTGEFSGIDAANTQQIVRLAGYVI